MNDEPTQSPQHQNPYRSPGVPDLTIQPELGEYYADPPYLVVRRVVRLPPRCVKTNEWLGEDQYEKASLFWNGNLFQIKMIPTQCVIFWTINPDSRQRIQFRRVWVSNLVGAGFITLLAIPLIGFSLGFGIAAAIAAVVCAAAFFAAAAWAYGKGEAYPEVVREKDGYYWISQCGKAFLDSLPTERSDEFLKESQ